MKRFTHGLTAVLLTLWCSSLVVSACRGPLEPESCPPNYAYEVAAVEIHHVDGIYVDTIHVFISMCVTPIDSIRDLRPAEEHYGGR